MKWRRLTANAAYWFRSSGRGIEHAAIFIVASVIALNIVALSSRSIPQESKPQEALVVSSKDDLPPPLLAGDTTAREQQTVRIRPKPVQRPRETAARPAPPPQPAAMFEPQRQILDATGQPALDPHRGAPLPLKLDIVAHADAAAEPPPESPAAVAPDAGTEPKTFATARKNKQRAGGSAERRQRRAVAAIEELAEAGQPRSARVKARKVDAANADDPAHKRTKLAKADLAMELKSAAKKAKSGTAGVAADPGLKKTKGSMLARSNARADPTPGEIVLRTLRGA